MKRLTTEDFVERARRAHGDKYDYSKVNYVGSKTKVCIICPEHGEFWQTPNSHLHLCGCSVCGLRKRSKSRTKPYKTILKIFKDVHGDRYDYSKVEYVNTEGKIHIICPVHGGFLKKVRKHINGEGCPKCSKELAVFRFKQRVLKNRNWDFEQPEDHKLIPLTQGKFAKVDNDDFERLKDINWSYDSRYVFNTEFGFIHRYIMDAPNNKMVDHANHDTLDNRKSNLRLSTNTTNQWNSRGNPSSSNFKGVYKPKGKNKYRARICNNGRHTIIGYFTDEEEAAKAYDKKAIELRGEWAYQTLNFPELLNEYLKEIENDKNNKLG